MIKLMLRTTIVFSFTCGLFSQSLSAFEGEAKAKPKEAPKAEAKEKQAAKLTEVKVQDITLQVPSTWKQKQTTSRLRLAQFDVSSSDEKLKPAYQSEIVVYYFGGGGGGIQANVTRWIGQFDGKGRTVKLTHGTSKNGKYLVVDVSGTYNRPIGPPIRQQTEAAPDSRMIGIILQVAEKGNYFLKMTGPDKVISEHTEHARTAIGAKLSEEKKVEVKAPSKSSE